MILLLCSAFTQSGMKPLSTRQYHRIAGWLHQEGLRPGNLLYPKVVKRLLETSDLAEAEAVPKLLQRAVFLPVMQKKWQHLGIQVVCRGESAYPQRLKKRLGHTTPPLLFYAGNIQLLYRGGLAVVGSREADQDACLFARKVAEVCVREGIQVLSGGAKGIDLEAMKTALRVGGTVVGVLPGNLARERRSEKYSKFIERGQLLLVSPYHPDADFSAGNAIGRNRFIYLLAEWALAVHANEAGKGGTWRGARENLTKRWVPLLVRDAASLPEGNQDLIAQGGKPLGENLFHEDFSLRNWINSFATPTHCQKKQSNLSK